MSVKGIVHPKCNSSDDLSYFSAYYSQKSIQYNWMRWKRLPHTEAASGKSELITPFFWIIRK